MATLKRTDSKTLRQPKPAPPPRDCVACCDGVGEDRLVKPCRECETDYCVDCLEEMFCEALNDRSRMPPRCCTVIQVHTIVDHLSESVASEYREKLEEWSAPTKTFCPAPTCSVFIPERKMPGTPTKSEAPSPGPFTSFLQDIVDSVQRSPSARFFRGEMDITQLPGYTKVVEHPMDLSMITANIPNYKAVHALTLDMQLLVGNAVKYNGPSHPVSEAANELLAKYFEALSAAAESLLRRKPTTATAPPSFPCHKCHIAICTLCKQVEHGERPCDTTAADQELAMLESFGCKRCPRCKAGVKKMYGCSHILCLCGAHWCYWCQKSITQCDGSSCVEREEQDMEDEEDYDSEEEEGEEGNEGEQNQDTRANGGEHGARNQTESNAQASAAPPPNTGARPDATEDLDAGGARRWADRYLDFGDEPDDDPNLGLQMWSCSHKFESFKVPKDEFNRGDYLKMECNRCFAKVMPRKPSLTSRGLHWKATTSAESSYGKWLRAVDKMEKGEEAWLEGAHECANCKMVACGDCKKALVVKKEVSG